MEKDSNKPNNNDNFELSNTGIIVIIILCLFAIIGISSLRKHNKQLMDDIGHKWLNEHPELIDKYVAESPLNDYVSPDGIFKFQYSDDWALDIESDDPLTIRLYNEKLASAMLIMKPGKNGLNNYESISQIEKTMSTQDGYKKDSGPIDCYINKTPGIRNNYHYYIGGNISYISNIHINYNEIRIVIVEIGCSTKDMNNNFKAIEQTFVINDDMKESFITESNDDGKQRLHKLYDAMSKHYNMSQSFNEFVDALEDRDNRQKVYDAMSKHYNMAQSFEEFDKELAKDYSFINNK